MANLMKFSNGVLFWDLRAIMDWELESLSSFMDIIYEVSLRGWGKTRCVGCQLGRRGFEVSSYYRVLACVSD